MVRKIRLAVLMLLLMVSVAFCGYGSVERPSATADIGQPSEKPQTINLVAVQMRARLDSYRDDVSFRQTIMRLMDRAAEKTQLADDTLVVFPENVGTLAVVANNHESVEQADTLEEGIENVVRGNLTGVLFQKSRRRVSWARALFLARQQQMAQIYFDTFSEAASRHGVYLAAGTAALTDAQMAEYVPADVPGSPDEQRASDRTNVYNVSVVFGPRGQVLGVARKTHLIDLEGPEGLDFSSGEVGGLQPIDTPLGTLGSAICLDAFRTQVWRHLHDNGVQILLQPSANPVPWEPWQQEEWLFSAAEAVNVGLFPYAVNPMLTGSILDLGFHGQSGIFASPEVMDKINVEGEAISGYQDIDGPDVFLRTTKDPSDEQIIHIRVPHPDLLNR